MSAEWSFPDGQPSLKHNEDGIMGVKTEPCWSATVRMGVDLGVEFDVYWFYTEEAMLISGSDNVGQLSKNDRALALALLKMLASGENIFVNL